MKVSVIVCTYSEERLKDCINTIESLLEQNYNNLEIIVAVDNNADVFKKIKKSFSKQILVVLNDLERGLSETRNVGIRKASGDIIAFIDDDAVADKDWIESLALCYNNQNVLAVGGSIIPIWEKARPFWFPEELDWIVGCTYLGHPERKSIVRNLIGCNMSFRKRVFNTVGVFKTTIGRLNNIPLAGEEYELCLRINKYFPQGEIIYKPSSKVYHKVSKKRESFKYIIKRSYYEGCSKVTINKYFRKKNLNTEGAYVKYLAYNAIPKRLLKACILIKPIENFSKAIVILASICATGLGYVLNMYR